MKNQNHEKSMMNNSSGKKNIDENDIFLTIKKREKERIRGLAFVLHCIYINLTFKRIINFLSFKYTGITINFDIYIESLTIQ